MHLGLMLITVGIAVAVRWIWHPGAGSWRQRWWWAVLSLCCPLVLLISTALAILSMGHHGTMLGWAVGPLGCRVSLGSLGISLVGLGYGLWQAGWTTWGWRRYPSVPLPQGPSARLVDTVVPLAVQVGFWRSALIVSRGWLEQLSPQEQAVILAHEQGHAHYHDPLWFWLLGIVRRLTVWLPHTQALWQELLLLREIRADRWATQHADPLAIAELLVKLSRQRVLEGSPLPSALVNFSGSDELDRLEQRVEALLHPLPAATEEEGIAVVAMGWSLALLPLVAIAFHQ